MSETVQGESRIRKRPPGWAFWGFALVAAFFLAVEHRAHLVEYLPYLPYLLLLACPLLHVFMGHGGHGQGHASRHDTDGERRP